MKIDPICIACHEADQLGLGHWHNTDFFCSTTCCGVNDHPVVKNERTALMEEFESMLWAVTGDGGKKRAAGAKPPWWRDDSHEAAIFSHLNKWKHGEKVDKDSGQHPLVHMAWRALAIAWQETKGKVNPVGGD